ncbi:MAG: ABC transporter ATP-binding protein [Chloroflexota bacterium]
MKASEPSIVAQGLTKRFGDFTAVAGISFEVNQGEIFGFLGPNGSGKTTTIRMLLGLLRPSAGSARVLGFDVTQQREEIRQLIGYMSQRFSLYGDLTVMENLQFYAGTYGVTGRELQERARAIVEVAGLAGREDERAANLAGGWRQRLALGTAIVHQPQMLFLDEPTAGMDPLSRRAFWDLLYELAEAGATIFVTTHYMDEAERCQTLAFIHEGHIVARGTPQAIKETQMPAQVLEVDCPEPEAAAGALRGLGIFDEVAMYGSLIHLIVPQAAAYGLQVEALLRQRGTPPRRVALVPPSLEDVFIASMKAINRANQQAGKRA